MLFRSKTTVGEALAERLGLPFADSDHIVEGQAGMSVSDIFVTEGESAFRVREADAVARALTDFSGVLALGGGAILNAETRERLRGHRVVWLTVGLSEACRRVGLNVSRPLLLGNVRGTLMKLMEERAPLYAEVATLTVATDDMSVDDVVDALVAATDMADAAVTRDMP